MAEKNGAKTLTLERVVVGTGKTRAKYQYTADNGDVLIYYTRKDRGPSLTIPAL